MEDAELVAFLLKVGLDPRDILDDAGAFDVRGMLRRLCLLP